MLIDIFAIYFSILRFILHKKGSFSLFFVFEKFKNGNLMI